MYVVKCENAGQKGINVNSYLKKTIALADELNKAEGFSCLMIIDEIKSVYNDHVLEIKQETLENELEKLKQYNTDLN